MTRFTSFSLLIPVLCLGAFALSGCTGRSEAVSDPESLLAAEGTWKINEDSEVVRSPSTYDPKDGESYRKDSRHMEAVPGTVVARLNALESEVAALRRDMDKVLPVLAQMVRTGEEARRLMGDVRTQQAKVAPAPAKVAPKAAPPARAPEAAPVVYGDNPPPAAGGAQVSTIRFGEHGGKTRVVLDLNSEAGFRYDLDNTEKVMVVELPTAGWGAAASRTMAQSPLVGAYTVQSADAGSRLILSLKKPVKVALATAMKPDSADRRGNRIVFDLVAE